MYSHLDVSQISKGYILYGSIYITFYKQNYRDGEQISGCQELQEGREVAGSIEGQHEGSLWQ